MKRRSPSLPPEEPITALSQAVRWDASKRTPAAGRAHKATTSEAWVAPGIASIQEPPDSEAPKMKQHGKGTPAAKPPKKKEE